MVTLGNTSKPLLGIPKHTELHRFIGLIPNIIALNVV